MTPAEPATDGRAARWSGHREKRRQQILDVALDVIDELGPQAAVQDFAQAAGVTRQVLYRQFTDRADLDIALTDRIAQMVYGHVVAALDTSSSEIEIEPTLRRALLAYLDFIDEHRSLYWFVRGHEADRSARAVAGVKDSIAQIGVLIAEEMAATGAARPEVPLDPVFTHGLIGLVDAAVTQWLAVDDPLPREQLVDGLVLVLEASVDALLGRRRT